MSKSKKAPKATETSGRGPGRPSTFPAGTKVVAFPTRVAMSTIEQLRELSEGRANHYGLAHNSIGAELARIVEEAYKRSMASRKAASAARKNAEEVPAEVTA